MDCQVDYITLVHTVQIENHFDVQKWYFDLKRSSEYHHAARLTGSQYKMSMIIADKWNVNLSKITQFINRMSIRFHILFAGIVKLGLSV